MEIYTEAAISDCLCELCEVKDHFAHLHIVIQVK